MIPKSAVFHLKRFSSFKPRITKHVVETNGNISTYSTGRKENAAECVGKPCLGRKRLMRIKHIPKQWNPPLEKSDSLMESKENHPIIIHKAGAKAAVFFFKRFPPFKKTPRKTKDTQVEAFQSARAAWLESASVLVRPLAPERGLSAHIPRRFNPMFTLQPPATPHFSQCQCERNADMVMGMVLVSFIHNPDMSKKKKYSTLIMCHVGRFVRFYWRQNQTATCFMYEDTQSYIV